MGEGIYFFWIPKIRYDWMMTASTPMTLWDTYHQRHSDSVLRLRNGSRFNTIQDAIPIL
jgi:hypothetical protein